MEKVIEPNNSIVKYLNIIRFENLKHFHSHQTNELNLLSRENPLCIIYIEKGYGKLSIDLNKYEYNDGSVIFLNNNQINTVQCINETNGFAATINQGFILDCLSNIRSSYFITFYSKYLKSPIFTVHDTKKRIIGSLFDELLIVNNEESPDRVINELLFSTLLYIVLNGDVKPLSEISQLNDIDKKRIEIFLTELEENFHLHIEANFYAKRMSVNIKSLNRICKKHFNLTAKKIIDIRMNEEIIKKLSKNDDSIQEIAAQLGFDDLSNFVKYFKRFNGLTPSSYRLTYRSK